ncbi:MAG: hypothetical protein DMF61_02340 [Blastocatellia bacterium AA13]|nr:MAG: hypothetical protein DMF61_02340 [Blastocatellia bacterium AA13]
MAASNSEIEISATKQRVGIKTPATSTPRRQRISSSTAVTINDLAMRMSTAARSCASMLNGSASKWARGCPIANISEAARESDALSRRTTAPKATGAAGILGNSHSRAFSMIRVEMR